MQFQTVFGFDQVSYTGWGPLLIGVLFVAFGALAVFDDTFLPALSRGRQAPPRWVAWAWLSFSVFWTLLATLGPYVEYRTARTAIEARRYSVVEGPVMGFTELPKRNERFKVEGKTFSYSGYIDTPGFHFTRSEGGPVNEGEYVRVTYLGSIILKLEIAR